MNVRAELPVIITAQAGVDSASATDTRGSSPDSEPTMPTNSAVAAIANGGARVASQNMSQATFSRLSGRGTSMGKATNGSTVEMTRAPKIMPTIVLAVSDGVTGFSAS